MGISTFRSKANPTQTELDHGVSGGEGSWLHLTRLRVALQIELLYKTPALLTFPSGSEWIGISTFPRKSCDPIRSWSKSVTTCDESQRLRQRETLRDIERQRHTETERRRQTGWKRVATTVASMSMLAKGNDSSHTGFSVRGFTCPHQVTHQD